MAKTVKEPDHLIVGVHIKDRLKKAGKVQRILTEHGGKSGSDSGNSCVTACHSPSFEATPKMVDARPYE